MRENINIVQAGNNDAKMLAELGAKTFKDAFGAQNNPEDLERYLHEAFSPEKMAAELTDPASSFYVAYQDRSPVGYIKLRTTKIPDCVDDPAPLELERIYVHQHAIGQGVGAALMQQAIAEGKGAGFQTIWLGVWKENAKAISFYQKWDYEIVGEHQFVVGTDVQHDYIMARPLV